MIVNHSTNECSLPDCFCHEAQGLESRSSKSSVATTFEHDWNAASCSRRRLTEESDALYWYTAGARAKEIELLELFNGDLQEIHVTKGPTMSETTKKTETLRDVAERISAEYGSEFELDRRDLTNAIELALRNERERCAAIAERQAGKNRTIGDTKAIAKAIREGK